MQKPDEGILLFTHMTNAARYTMHKFVAPGSRTGSLQRVADGSCQRDAQSIGVQPGEGSEC